MYLSQLCRLGADDEKSFLELGITEDGADTFPIYSRSINSRKNPF